jgi:hypothetical protein
MRQANGETKNHVMWRGSQVPFDRAWATFIGWMEAIQADGSAHARLDKTIADKPAAAVDGCWTSPTEFIAEPQTFSREPTSACNTRFPSFGFPRLVAGGPLAADLLKCQLKTPAPQFYAAHFTPAEWSRLQRIFPKGVCDWTKSGVEQHGVFPWASFGPAPWTAVIE